MKRTGKMLTGLAIGLSLVAVANGMVNDANKGSYEGIAQRNVFNLHGPSPGRMPEPITPPPIQIRLTGITTIFGDKRALFMVQPPVVAGQPAGKEESCILAEGQRQGTLEVLAIDEKAGTVRVSSEGKVSVIAFPTPKLPNAPTTAPMPAGTRVMPTVPPPMPAAL
jgi:hypothetical protein